MSFDGPNDIDCSEGDVRKGVREVTQADWIGQADTSLKYANERTPFAEVRLKEMKMKCGVGLK